jgi:choline kinase
MKAVILAAGIASRLRPLTNNTPKCLLNVGEKNILELTIENLLSYNFCEIVIVTGYLEDQIRDFIRKRFPDLHVKYINNSFYASTNNIYSLWLAKDAVLGDDMLMMDSDIVFEKKIISELIDSGFENCLALKRHEIADEEIKVKIDANGRVMKIGKEVNPAEAAGESIGIEVFGKETVSVLFQILDRKIIIEKNVNQFYETAFEELVNTGHDLNIIDCSEYFCMEIDTESDLKNAELIFSNSLSQNNQI